MPERSLAMRLCAVGIFMGLCAVLSGCAHFDNWTPAPPHVPTEVKKEALGPYRVEPPDVLQINAVNLLPKANHRIQPLDVVRVQFPYKSLSADEMKALTALNLIIDNNFPVELGGTVTFVAPYNLIVNIHNMTQQQAEEEIANQIKKVANPDLVAKGGVKVRIVQAQGLQVIQGNHLVRPDGTVTLGIYGSVFVAGLTTDEIRQKVEAHLSHYLEDPVISVEVVGYNSKVYYVIYDGGGNGEQVTILPVTGNETVLDAVGKVNGLPAVASKSLIWVSRPNPDGGEGCILPVDWFAITQRGVAGVNYQMMPNDRLYVKADPLITLYTGIDRFVSPIERVLGTILLGTSVYREVKFANTNVSSGNINGGF